MPSSPTSRGSKRTTRIGHRTIAAQRTTRHGRAAHDPNPPGVNDLVKALYPQIAIEYVQLHSASVAVRYGLGLSGYDPSALASAYQTIASAAGAGDLTAA
jgi:hypothetical protein